MSTMRRSLPALDRLYYALDNKIKNLHKPKIAKLNNEISDLDAVRAKEIIADIEGYAFGKYPELRHVLNVSRIIPRCITSKITLGFWFDGVRSPLADQLKLFVVQEKEAETEDLKQLERWKMQCLQAMAAGEGFPPIGISGIEDVSSENQYYG